MDINKLTLIGRLTYKPQQEGRTVRLSLLTTYHWQDWKTKERKDAEETILIYAVGKLADICKTYLKENSRIYCEARLQNGHFVADEIIMLSTLHHDREPLTDSPNQLT